MRWHSLLCRCLMELFGLMQKRDISDLVEVLLGSSKDNRVAE